MTRKEYGNRVLVDVILYAIPAYFLGERFGASVGWAFWFIANELGALVSSLKAIAETKFAG